MRVAILTVGCKLNRSDSDALRAALSEAGHVLVEDPADAEAAIVNTCTVTSEADRDDRQLLRRARRANPGALVVAVGCYAETDAALLESMPEVDWALRRDEVADLPEALREGRRPRSRELPATLAPRRAESIRARPQLAIQDGCDCRCRYCKVSLARGPERSLPRADALRGLRELAEAGAGEVVVVGCNLGAWGRGLAGAESLSDLLREALTLPLPRIRLGSIEPRWLTEELCDLIADSGGRICPHLHVPVQSGSARILAEMGRPDDIEPLVERVARLRRRLGLLALGVDLLVGYPGETDDDFARTLELVERLAPTRIHAFPFSPRPGTVAAELPDSVPRAVKRERVGALVAESTERGARFLLAHLGEPVAMLVERRDGEWALGTTATYVAARAACSAEPGAVVEGLAVATEGHRLSLLPPPPPL